MDDNKCASDDGNGAASASATSPSSSSNEKKTCGPREAKFAALLNEKNVDLGRLSEASWTGIPRPFRAQVWQILLGYLPSKAERRDEVLARKRREYRQNFVTQYYDAPNSARSEADQRTLRQILVDVPRTLPELPIFQDDAVQKSMERILYIWSIRHPASGYVQGINDLVTPFYVAFLSAKVCGGDIALVKQMKRLQVAALDDELMWQVEADSYWCLTRLLDGIQDHYTFSQPGIQRMVFRLQDIVKRIDAPLYHHVESEGLNFMQFAFRWMNCLLLREMPLELVVRLWDTYTSEPAGGFDHFHVYVCAALFVTWSEKLRSLQFQDLVMFLQALPTDGWSNDDVEALLSQAYILKTLFDRSPHHLA